MDYTSLDSHKPILYFQYVCVACFDLNCKCEKCVWLSISIISKSHQHKSSWHTSVIWAFFETILQWCWFIKLRLLVQLRRAYFFSTSGLTNCF